MLSLKYLQRTLCNNAPSLKSPNESLRWIDVTWVASCFAKCHAWTHLKKTPVISIFSEKSPPFLVGGEWSCFLWFFWEEKTADPRCKSSTPFKQLGSTGRAFSCCTSNFDPCRWRPGGHFWFGIPNAPDSRISKKKKTSCSNWNTMEKSREKAQLFCFFFGGGGKVVMTWMMQFSCDWTCFLGEQSQSQPGHLPQCTYLFQATESSCESIKTRLCVWFHMCNSMILLIHDHPKW